VALSQKFSDDPDDSFHCQPLLLLLMPRIDNLPVSVTDDGAARSITATLVRCMSIALDHFHIWLCSQQQNYVIV